MEKKNDNKKEQTPVAMDDYEKGISLNALREEKVRRQQRGSPTRELDDLIIKIGSASNEKGNRSQ